MLPAANFPFALHEFPTTRRTPWPLAAIIHPTAASIAPDGRRDADTNYPSRSGLQDRLAAEGFKLHWVREEMVRRRRGEGWEVVVAKDEGRRVTFTVPPGMPSVDRSALVLMKRRA